MYDFKICIIKNSFIKKYPNLKKESSFKEKRIYLGIKIIINNNNYFIPFESKLYKHPRLVNVSQYPVPSETRPDAGLNFEKCLIVNNPEYIEEIMSIEEAKIANTQKNILLNNKVEIINKFNLFIEKYINSCKKNREKRDFIFKYSTLHEFKKELDV